MRRPIPAFKRRQRRKDLRNYVLGTALLLAAAGLLGAAAYHAYSQEPGCVTDSECMAECPPPADDAELCDGGPQPALVHIVVRG